MCEHCGCRGVAPLAELMDEHLLLEVAVTSLGAAGWDLVTAAHDRSVSAGRPS